MEIWPCAGAPGNEAPLKDLFSSNEMYSKTFKSDPATLSPHSPVEILWSPDFHCYSSSFSERSLCFTNHDDFNILCVNTCMETSFRSVPFGAVVTVM